MSYVKKKKAEVQQRDIWFMQHLKGSIFFKRIHGRNVLCSPIRRVALQDTHSDSTKERTRRESLGVALFWNHRCGGFSAIWQCLSGVLVFRLSRSYRLLRYIPDGHFCSLHNLSSNAFPWQVRPFLLGFGLSHCRTLCCLPLPQLLLQVFHEVHDDQPPLMITTGVTAIISMEYPHNVSFFFCAPQMFQI